MESINILRGGIQEQEIYTTLFPHPVWKCPELQPAWLSGWPLQPADTGQQRLPSGYPADKLISYQRTNLLYITGSETLLNRIHCSIAVLKAPPHCSL